MLKDGVWQKYLELFLKRYERVINLKVEELEKDLKNENLNSLYLLYGEEKFLLENSLKKIKNLFGECLKGINYITIDDTNLRRNNFRFRNSMFWI